MKFKSPFMELEIALINLLATFDPTTSEGWQTRAELLANDREIARARGIVPNRRLCLLNSENHFDKTIKSLLQKGVVDLAIRIGKKKKGVNRKDRIYRLWQDIETFDYLNTYLQITNLEFEKAHYFKFLDKFWALQPLYYTSYGVLIRSKFDYDKYYIQKKIQMQKERLRHFNKQKADAETHIEQTNQSIKELEASKN